MGGSLHNLIVILVICANCSLAQYLTTGEALFGGKNGWYKGNSHFHPQAQMGINNACQWYHDNDFDYIILTEHRTFLSDDDVSFAPRRDNFLVIAGEEFNSNTSFGSSHVSVANTTRQIGDIPNSTNSAPEYYDMVNDLVKQYGGFAIINHPTWARQMPADDFLEISEIQHFEVFNGALDTDNYGIFEDITPIDDLWDEVLTRGGKFYGVGSDDMHVENSRPGDSNPGAGFTMIKPVALTVEGVLDAYRRGYFYASNGVILKDISSTLGHYKVVADQVATEIELKRRDDYEYGNPAKPVPETELGFRIEFIGPNGEILKSVQGDSADFQVTNDLSFVRARVMYVRPITNETAPYVNRLGQADYVSDNNFVLEEYRAWGQPYFTDDRREGPALVFGCTDDTYLEYDEIANVLDTTACITRDVTVVRQGHFVLEEHGGLAINIPEGFGSYRIEIRSLKGSLVHVEAGNTPGLFEFSELVPLGTYIINIKGSKRLLSKKVMVY